MCRCAWIYTSFNTGLDSNKTRRESILVAAPDAAALGDKGIAAAESSGSDDDSDDSSDTGSGEDEEVRTAQKQAL